MKGAKAPGYLVLGLSQLESTDWESFQDDGVSAETNFFSRSKKYYLQSQHSNVSKPLLNRRFTRLQAIAENFYSYCLEYTKSNISSILQECAEEYDRVVIFESSDLVEHFAELQKILSLNSYLKRRIIRSGDISNLFLPFGYIKKKLLNRILKGKGNSVTPYTFQMIKLVVDKDLQSNVVPIYREEYLEA
ncbi:MAG: hypothetical protein AAF518_00240 [Spirochaetota bacterium]